jgi:DNA repair exonuclease SbcCD ATPase subunit
VPEISGRDLRRLQSLEDRLTREQTERRALAAERRDLRTAVAANARRARDAEKELAACRSQVEALLRENSALAGRLEEARADLGQLQSASLELRDQVDKAHGELAAAQKALAAAQKEVGAIKGERDGLLESLKLANEQLAGKEITPVLQAKDVANLVDGFVLELGSGLPGLAVREGEIRLQVAFARVGEVSGFVVPSAESPPEVRENLHQVSVRFDRSLELPES